MSNQPDITKVVFRKWPKGDIIALFPEVPSDANGWECMSFEHVGQHGGATYDHCVNMTTPATPAEYKDTQDELIKDYGYTLDICQKRTEQMRQACMAEARRIRNL